MKRKRLPDHPFVKRCSKCTLIHDKVSVIGEYDFRCLTCGGVQFGIVRRKEFIRALIWWYWERWEHRQQELFN